MAVSRPRGSRTRLAVLVLAAVSVIAVDERDPSVVGDLRDAADVIFDPFERAGQVVSSPLRESWTAVRTYQDVEDQEDRIAELEQALSEAQSSNVADEDATRQYEELSASVDLPFTGDLREVAGKVTSGPQSNFSSAVEINRGSDQGVAVGMPVVADGGLVGRVQRVSPGSSSVALITDPESQVGVRLAETGALGTTRGQGRNEPLVIESSIDPDTDVAEGSGLVTSGVDRSVFPDGIPVALVSETRPGAGGLTLELVAEPLVEFDRLHFVSVLLWEPPG